MNVLRRTGLNALRLVRQSSLYEPEYLEFMKPKFPLYDALNIQMRGFDYVVLESYQKYLHQLMRNMDLDVENGWALPCEELQIVTYKPQSEIVNDQYKLQKYHRTIQITDVSTLQIPVLLRVIEATTPAGVTVEVVPHEDHHEEERYVPDTELLKLKDELDEMGGPSKKK